MCLGYMAHIVVTFYCIVADVFSLPDMYCNTTCAVCKKSGMYWYMYFLPSVLAWDATVG